ncbi:MAG: 30S ribosomal protein S8e [Desulfurococcales archaeon]|nr:30S ribosomal protein S8e [Desulfurococcales archaeon]
MGVYQWRDHKKRTGGKKNWYYKVKRKYAHGKPFVPAMLAEEGHEVRHVPARGGNYKLRLRKTSFAIVANPKTGEVKKVRIKRVLETPANREYARRHIIIKGAIIETELGKARVTSRPGQDGIVNAVLIEED